MTLIVTVVTLIITWQHDCNGSNFGCDYGDPECNSSRN